MQHIQAGEPSEKMPPVGTYRAVEFATGFFVQCVSERTSTQPVRRWWGYADVRKTFRYWRTVLDSQRSKETGGPVAMNFDTLEAAQAFVDKLRYNEANYPKYHDLK